MEITTMTAENIEMDMINWYRCKNAREQMVQMLSLLVSCRERQRDRPLAKKKMYINALIKEKGDLEDQHL